MEQFIWQKFTNEQFSGLPTVSIFSFLLWFYGFMVL
jgi:hypothetical protein